MKNISKEDYVLFNHKKNELVDPYDVVYHYTTIVEMLNDGFKIKEHEMFVPVAGLSRNLQAKISVSIELTKDNGFLNRLNVISKVMYNGMFVNIDDYVTLFRYDDDEGNCTIMLQVYGDDDDVFQILPNGDSIILEDV